MDNSRKAQDILKGRIIATIICLFFLVMGLSTILSRQYNIPLELNNIKQVMLSELDFYMGLIQMCLALIPLAAWFNTKKNIFLFIIFVLVLSLVFFMVICSQIL